MTRVKRRYLGRFGDLASRTSIYERGNAIEVDEQDAFHIRRRRVFYEDVQLVTMHDSVGLAGIFFGFGIATIFLLLAFAMGRDAGWIMAVAAAPFLAYGIARLTMRDAIITVFGRRSKARIRFTLSPKKARRIYDELCEKVRAAQSE